MNTFEKTMERLRKLRAGRPVTEKEAVEMLSYEIDDYRNLVEDLRAQINSMKEEAAEKAASGSGTTKQAGPEGKDCTRCEYGPVWNDVCRTCKGKDPAYNVKDQLVRKEDVLNQIPGIITVPYKMPEKDLNNIIKWTQKYIQELAYRIRMLPPASTAEPMEDVRTCPFCGGRATVVEQGTGISCAWVECGQCGTRTRTFYGENKVDRAVNAWNRRTPGKDPEDTSMKLQREIEERIPRWEENKMPHIKGQIRTPEP